MAQIPFKPFVPPYPAPIGLVGAHVDGKVNFVTVAWFSAITYAPPTLMVALHHAHHTNVGIHQTGEFSLCLPTRDMSEITDYCGVASGRDHDKASIFTVFYGALRAAPLISQCPLNVECKVTQVHRVGANEVFFGEIEQVHAAEACVVDGKPDLGLIRPLLFDGAAYRVLGDIIDKAWSSGKNFKR